MRWGFGWELGPFEMLDAIGIEAVLEAARGHAPELLDSGVPPCSHERWRTGRPAARRSVAPAAPGLQILRAARDVRRVVKTNPGASLVDLGDGVLCRRVPLEDERHRRRHRRRCCRPACGRRRRTSPRLVVGNEAPHFSAGANLMLVLLEAQEENWDEIDLMVRAFQQRDDGAALRRRAGGRGAGRAGARRRLRDRAARRPRAGGGRNLHGARRGGRRPDSRPAAARRR